MILLNVEFYKTNIIVVDEEDEGAFGIGGRFSCSGFLLGWAKDKVFDDTKYLKFRQILFQRPWVKRPTG